MVSFFGTKGAHAARDRDGHDWTDAVMENNPVVPELILLEKPKDWPAVLRELLDSVWQGLGELRCPYYGKGDQFKLG